MKNCADCESYKNSYGTKPDGYIFISENHGSSLGVKYAKCESGYNDEMKAWWDANGNIPKADTKEMPCYIPNVLDKLLRKMDNILNN